MSDYAEAETQFRFSLSLIDTERLAGTTAPALLKGHRVGILTHSAKLLSDNWRFSEALPQYEESLAYYETIGDTARLIE